jgi:hypothetical protein
VRRVSDFISAIGRQQGTRAGLAFNLTGRGGIRGRATPETEDGFGTERVLRAGMKRTAYRRAPHIIDST